MIQIITGHNIEEQAKEHPSKHLELAEEIIKSKENTVYTNSVYLIRALEILAKKNNVEVKFYSKDEQGVEKEVEIADEVYKQYAMVFQKLEDMSWEE